MRQQELFNKKLPGRFDIGDGRHALPGIKWTCEQDRKGKLIFVAFHKLPRKRRWTPVEMPEDFPYMTDYYHDLFDTRWDALQDYFTKHENRVKAAEDLLKSRKKARAALRRTTKRMEFRT